MKKQVQLLCSFSVILPLLGCALTNPSARHYRIIHEPMLHSSMRAMGLSLGTLAELYYEKDDASDEQQAQRVLAELNKIERIASNLGGDDVVTNYSVINRYMGAFLYDVSVAKEFAQREQPNFVPAYRLIKSCQSCHQSM